jgi:cytochrome P450
MQPEQILAFDPQSASFSQDPYPIYAKLRQDSTPVHHAGLQAVLLSRYDHVDQAARHNDLVRSQEVFMTSEAIARQKQSINWHDMPNHERFVQTSLLDSDGETHDRLRLLVLRTFSRSLVNKHRSMIATFVDNLLDQLLEQRDIDFIADLAAQVPGHVIGRILGVPDDDCPQLRIWSEDIVQFFDVARTELDKQSAERATTEFSLYLSELIEARKKNPQEDLISTLISAQHAGQLTATELISTCMLILMAGHGSTIDVLGTGLYTLLQHPDQWQQLKNNPEHIASAVQEMFRYESPLPYFHRYAATDIELFGHHYPQGTKFGLLYGAANRDPAAFPQPDVFDIRRQPNRHIAFGRGAHLCLGNHLARLDMEVIFLSLIERVADITLTKQDIRFKPGLSTRGLTTLPVHLLPK